MTNVKRIPYGISDFKQLRREDKYYVDKTMYLPVMEEADNFLFLVRPRRFGKSIFLSMMRAYYDINERNQFDKLFEGLWIHEHPTSLRGQFQVLHLDFSQIMGGYSVSGENVYSYLSIMIDDFARRYAHLYPAGYYEDVKGLSLANAKLNYINQAAKTNGHRMYLIIDEYDNFTNSVLNEKGENVYHALTHGEGFYRDLFKKFKGNYDRILMMGVSPVTMDDVTSGYNIASNITMHPEFNQMLGFSEDDVRQMIRYYQGEGMLKRDEENLIGEMKPWYDNYCFAQEVVDTDPKMFNCDMVCYYLKHVIQTGNSPRQMIDPNTRTDYKKMRRLIQLDNLDGNRRGILHQIAEDGYYYATLAESFPAERMADEQNFVSLLFYYGMLTIESVYGMKLKLSIPNNNVRLQYYGYLMEDYQRIAPIDTQKLSNAYDLAALEGEWEPMVSEIARIYEATTSVRQLIEGERNLQGFMNAYLTLNAYYLTAPEMELNHGYCDFFLMPDLNRYPMVKHSYIMELKYLRQNDSEVVAEEQWNKAVEQIRDYAQAPMVEVLRKGTQLHLLILQFRGYRMVRRSEIKPLGYFI
jgi:hypothetical protein